MALYNNVPGTSNDCAFCHGATGNGGPGPGPDINPLSMRGITTVQQVVTQINNGGNGMPTNFTTFLTPAEVQAVAQYVFDTFS
jgi:mono/diheme cytochrome c family protein